MLSLSAGLLMPMSQVASDLRDRAHDSGFPDLVCPFFRRAYHAACRPDIPPVREEVPIV
jgi:hypothetical protein